MTYRTISIEFWSDPKVLDDFEKNDKYLYMYLLTNAKTNICGCYGISFTSLESETKMTREECVSTLERLDKELNVIRFNSETREVLILNWCRYNWNKSVKLVRAVENAAEYIKCEEFKDFVLNKVHELDVKKQTGEDNSTSNSNSISNRTSTSTVGYPNEKKQYPINRVSRKRNFTERNNDYELLEAELIRKGQ